MEIEYDNLIKLFDSFRLNYETLNDLCEEKGICVRMPNFPEYISENIVRQYIINYENKICKWVTTKGDLIIKDNNEKLRVEVKCFSSKGPSSFGPNEYWDVIYFVDATKFIKSKFKIYKINLSSKSKKFRKIKVNNEETFGEQCEQGRRPRISFKLLKQQLEDNVELVFSGKITDLNQEPE